MQGRLNLAGGLAVLGAVLLLVGLSLDWYEPQISAWTAFEIVDLLLAAIAAAVAAVSLARGPGRPRLEALGAWLPIAALAALVLVLAALVNPPPAAIDRPLEIGAWVSLLGALLLVAAALLRTTKVSVVVTMRPRSQGRADRSERSDRSEEWSLAAEERAWEDPLEEPFAGPPLDEPPTGEHPIDADDELAEPTDEGIVPAPEVEPEDETQPLPRRRGD